MSAPTEKQYRYLRCLGSGAAIVFGPKRQTEMYLRRGWVTAGTRTPAVDRPHMSAVASSGAPFSSAKRVRDASGAPSEGNTYGVGSREPVGDPHGRIVARSVSVVAGDAA